MARCSEEEVNENGKERHIESDNRGHICQHGVSHAYKPKINVYTNGEHGTSNYLLQKHGLICFDTIAHADEISY